MTIPPELREQVRSGARFACEYCGVTETDTAGQLTVDHFQPRAHGGSDELSNLLYCCPRCNLYKADYWPAQPSDSKLWNPREESVAAHLVCGKKDWRQAARFAKLGQRGFRIAS